MKKIVILSSYTLHHRYFIYHIFQKNIEISLILMETVHVESPFSVGELFDAKEDQFEEEHFFEGEPYTLPSGIVEEVANVNDKNSIKLLKEIEPDFGIVFGTGKISKEVIDILGDGLINVHRGIAERYRGLDSDLWAIYHHDYENIGVTIHKVFSALDTGDIAYCEKMPVLKNMKIFQIRYYTTVIATKLVIKAIFAYLSGELKFKPQLKKGRYYSFMPVDLKKVVQDRFNKYCERL